MSNLINFLRAYFTSDLEEYQTGQSWGLEIETSFIQLNGQPITIDQSQLIFIGLVAKDWRVITVKNGLYTEISNPAGYKLMYELGRQNIEVV